VLQPFLHGGQRRLLVAQLLPHQRVKAGRTSGGCSGGRGHGGSCNAQKQRFTFRDQCYDFQDSFCQKGDF
jgi:hypothetical protein